MTLAAGYFMRLNHVVIRIDSTHDKKQRRGKGSDQTLRLGCSNNNVTLKNVSYAQTTLLLNHQPLQGFLVHIIQTVDAHKIGTP